MNPPLIEKKPKSLLLSGDLLLTRHRFPFPFPGSRIRAGPLTVNRQSPPVAKPAVTPDIHEPFDVHLGFAAQSSFDLVIGCDDRSDFCNFLVAQFGDLLAPVHSRLIENFAGCGISDAVDIRQPDDRALIFR